MFHMQVNKVKPDPLLFYHPDSLWCNEYSECTNGLIKPFFCVFVLYFLHKRPSHVLIIGRFLWRYYAVSDAGARAFALCEEQTNGDFPFRSPFTLRFLAQGEYNINYVLEQEGRKQVLRVNTASQIRQANQIKYEYDALQLLKGSGVTPKPLYLDDSKAEIPYGLLTMEFVPGRPLRYATDLSRAARIFGQIHSLPVPRNHPLLTEERLFSARIDEAQLRSPMYGIRAVFTCKAFFAFMDWAEAHRTANGIFWPTGILSSTIRKSIRRISFWVQGMF